MFENDTYTIVLKLGEHKVKPCFDSLIKNIFNCCMFFHKNPKNGHFYKNNKKFCFENLFINIFLQNMNGLYALKMFKNYIFQLKI